MVDNQMQEVRRSSFTGDKLENMTEITVWDENNPELEYPIKEIYQHETGLIATYDYRDKKVIKQYGRNKIEYTLDEYKKQRPQNITLNGGLPNQAELEFEYDEDGKITDIKVKENKEEKEEYFYDVFTEKTYKMLNAPKIKMSDEQKQELMDILNQHMEIGKDFDIDISEGNLKINPIVRNKDGEDISNLPESLRKDMIELMKQGFRNGGDYDININDDGSYEIDFQSDRIKNYLSDEQIITYSADGKTKTIMTTSGDTLNVETLTGNSQTITTSNRSDELLMKLLEGNFKAASKLLGDVDYELNDFDFYAVCKKYQDLSGKNLMQQLLQEYKKGNLDPEMIRKMVPTIFWKHYGNEVPEDFVLREYNENLEMFNIIKNYNPQTSQVANLIFKSSAKQTISENKYRQTINGKNFEVEMSGNKIKVTCNGNQKSINISHLNSNLQKTIFDVNPMALYQIASKGTQLVTLEQSGVTQNGGYCPEENEIAMNSGRALNSYFKQTVVHETGHTVYNSFEYPRNEKFEKSFAQEKKAWKKSDERFKEGNHAFCTESPDEFFAEAYTLLTTGNCKSAYTICKYFPKTLAIVREMIEK